MKILKGYVFRMYPNENQENLINKTIGCTRFVYNHFLDEKINEYKQTGKSKSAYDQTKELKELQVEYPFLKEVDKYYVSVLIEEPLILPLFTPKNIVGIDLGIKDLIITSNNEKIENSIETKNLKKRIKGLQKGLTRCKVGSKNRYKIKIKLQRCYQKLRNMRKHLIHDITNKLINENDIIAVENLDIKNMQKNHHIAKALVDTSFFEIIRVLKYKSIWNNKKLIQINRYYPSSQICSRCDYKNEKVKDLRIRKWECPNCTALHDRDLNAAINIMWEGIKKYMKGLEQA